MITFARSYKTTDGKCFATLEEAQAYDMAMAIGTGTQTPEDIAYGKIIVERKQTVLDILTITDSSRPKARGVRKPRKSKSTIGTLPLEQSVA